MRRQRFPVMLTVRERMALRALAHHEGLSAAGVLRRLLYKEVTRLDLWVKLGSAQPRAVVTGSHPEAEEQVHEQPE